jgi:hypothetical protein
MEFVSQELKKKKKKNVSYDEEERIIKRKR